jgi:radical SAM superfamily enzyme YgiQ (UPF0313 family)
MGTSGDELITVMPDIVLTTLNAKYIHAAFGLRYLMANLGSLRARAAMLEFDINQRPLEIVEKLVAQEPKIIGFGVYIWNAGPTTEVVAMIRRLRPHIKIFLGGPEISHETERQEMSGLADYVITGEADLKFGEMCGQILGGHLPGGKVIEAGYPSFEELTLPYELYTEQDIAHRVVYVEASRGCPFKCEFCLSALDIPLRQVPLGALLGHLDRLLARGARQLKFVDRTFNLNIETAQAILEFLLGRYQPGHLYHFEMIPDRLPVCLRDVIARFPAGALQLEIGVQSFNAAVCERISRRQNIGKVEETFRFLREKTGAHLHADLIIGLPGEGLESFGAGFDRLVALGPQEIQVGILKRLRGAPIARHDAEWGMVYNPSAPYEILENKLIEFGTMQRLRRFSRYWDLVANSGNFVETTPLLWEQTGSPFAGFLRWSDWLFERVSRTDGIALSRLFELVYTYLTKELKVEASLAGERLSSDYRRGGRKDTPSFLCGLKAPGSNITGTAVSTGRRQARHLRARSNESAV